MGLFFVPLVVPRFRKYEIEFGSRLVSADFVPIKLPLTLPIQVFQYFLLIFND